MIEDFHFLRPLWLLAIPAALLLIVIVTRRSDVRRRWRKTIAAHLLEHLVVEPRTTLRLRPVHGTALLLALGGLAAAGPTWQHERPPFVEDTAPLAIAVDLSPTMDAIDVAPTRLERTKLKIRDLLALRAGARTALYVYAGSAHRVLPLTDDTSLLQTYVDSLATKIMPRPGKDSALALRTIAKDLERESSPGTIVFLTDGIEPRAVDAFRRYADSGREQLLVLGVGTAEGGPVRSGAQSYLNDASGRRMYAKLDVDALRKFGSDTGIPVATITVDTSDDVDWIQRRVQSHLRAKQADQATRWLDAGWWLTLPLALLGALWFRRGWTIRWAGVLVVAWLASGAPSPAQAAEWRFADLWLTPDQQGRWAYEHGDYETAAARFADPLLKGVALYRAGKYDAAVDAFARVDCAQSWFDQGNALAHLGRYPAAVAAYQEALKHQPHWAAAEKNLALVQKLIPKPGDEEEEEAPNVKPDEIQFDDKGKKGEKGRMMLPEKEQAEMWMRNIQTTPTQLLTRKFAIEAARAHETKP
jgi:Ca-activated chloride channel family protein